MHNISSKNRKFPANSFSDSRIILIFAHKLQFIMSEETKDIEEITMTASEPTAVVDYSRPSVLDNFDYDFGNVDFGYAKTEAELRDALNRVDSLRDDQSQWGTFSEMMSDFQKEHSEWFR